MPDERSLIRSLASLKLTLVGMVWLAAASLPLAEPEVQATSWLAAPLLLLAVNLLAAVATSATFRRQVGLLVFHLALFSLVALAAAGRLTYLSGGAEVTLGTEFSGLRHRDSGPLHWDRTDRIRFVNEGLDIRYDPGPVRMQTVSRVSWRDEDGNLRTGEISENRPLAFSGYLFSITSNKGFAPLLRWLPRVGEPVLGAVHLPSYPGNAGAQSGEFELEGFDAPIWVMLAFEEDLIPSDRPSTFRLPDDRSLIVRIAEGRWELQPGQRILLPDGELEYLELRTWTGYAVHHDWTVPWLLAICVVGVLGLTWHFLRKTMATPWHRGD